MIDQDVTSPSNITQFITQRETITYILSSKDKYLTYFNADIVDINGHQSATSQFFVQSKKTTPTILPQRQRNQLNTNRHPIYCKTMRRRNIDKLQSVKKGSRFLVGVLV